MPASDLATLAREALVEFCEEFIRHPYRCYTEHGLHALFYARFSAKLLESERFQLVDGKEVCVIQKEYPTDHNLGRSRRQHWDIAILKVPIEVPAETPAGDRPYDHLPLAAVIEFGMNADRNHLCGDISRLSHRRANVERPFIAHFYRFSGATRRISRRDWSSDAKGRCELEEIKQMLATPRTNCPHCTKRNHKCIHLQEPLSQPACPPRPIVVYCAVADEADPGRNGAWEITADDPIKRLV